MTLEEADRQHLAAYPVFGGTVEERWSSPEQLARDVRTERARLLPEHMIPDTITMLDRMPVNHNGKLDRSALPRPERGGGRGRPPRSSDEEVLAELFAQALGVDRVDVTESFFARGGHSLLAIHVINRVRPVLGTELDVRTVFEAPSVEAPAVRIRQGGHPRRPVRTDPAQRHRHPSCALLRGSVGRTQPVRMRVRR